MAFCRWLSAQLDMEIRLPTEVEWEKAARGMDGSKYPWGDGYNRGFANINEAAGKAGPAYLQQPTAAGVYPQGASIYGVLDTAGNVWEWCVNKADDSEDIATSGTAGRVMRGGAWNYSHAFARCTVREWSDPNHRNDSIGFRVSRSSASFTS